MTSRERNILSALALKPLLTRELIDGGAVPARCANHVLDGLSTRGWIEQVRISAWRITAAGRAALDAERERIAQPWWQRVCSWLRGRS